MSDDLLSFVSEANETISMTKRQARLLYEIIREKVRQREDAQKVVSDAGEFVLGETMLTDLEALNESIYFDAGLGVEESEAFDV